MEKTGAEVKTRFEIVLLQMREMILSGQLRPGTRVQEILIGERLGVSRTPVRLSLSVLEQEGLVRGEPNRGFVVREFTDEDVLAAYDVRAVLEGYACRIVAERGVTAPEEQALDDCLGTGDSLLAPGFFDASAIREWSQMNGRFHGLLIEASGNAALASALDLINKRPLAAPTSIVFRTHNLERLFVSMCKVQREHAEIVCALKRRDVQQAEAMMNAHVLESRDTVYREIQEKRQSLPEFFLKMA